MKNFCFDIDETICHTKGTDYENSKPISTRIDQINNLKTKGNKIIFFTARGLLVVTIYMNLLTINSNHGELILMNYI